MSGDQIAQVVALMACLALAWRNLQGQGTSGATNIKMAIGWIGIIAALALAVRLLAPGAAS